MELHKYHFTAHRPSLTLDDVMPKIAYSYVRFSRLHQSEGDSVRRQLETTRAYCQKKNLILDESLVLRDEGVSAFKSRNSEQGALGLFLDLCKEGRIAKDSALVVENFDRLSRDTPDRAVGLLLQIISYDIELHLTMADMVFNREDKKDIGPKLMMAIMYSTRAHEESETKSRRLREAFQRKRERVAAGDGVFSKTVPWWLAFDTKGKIVAVPERARVLRNIFKLKAEGWSSQRIARHLNKENVPTWRPTAKEWSDSRVRDAIRYDMALGYLSPTSKTISAGMKYEPIADYYPRIISDELAAEARGAIKARLVGASNGINKSGRPANLFRGILRHGGRWCRYQPHRNGTPGPDGKRTWHGYYDDHNPDAEGAKTWSIAASQLEPVIVHGLLELKPEDLLPARRENHLRRSVQFRKSILVLDEKISRLVSAIENGTGSKALSERLQILEQEKIIMRRDLIRAEAEEGTLTNGTNPLRSLSKNLLDPATRARTAFAVKRLIYRIDVAADYHALRPVFPAKLYRDMVTALKNLEAQPLYMKDPIIANKRRKPIAILLSFRSGAYRLLVRSGLESAGILNLRVDSEEREVETVEPFPSDHPWNRK